MVTTNAELKKALQVRVDSGDPVSAFTLALIDQLEEVPGAAPSQGNDEIHVQDLTDDITFYAASDYDMAPVS